MIGNVISHYKILEKLGEGGMGVVYKAEDTKLKRTVALKFLPPSFSFDNEAKTRFIHEAQSASSLQHNNICAIHEIDETNDNQLFICMDFYEGETLKEKIAKGPIEINEAIDITLQICEGLEKAHKNNIVHRDIKPANIFITNEGVVKILDFGLAKSKGQTQLTKMESTLGTVDYMSPEQVQGSKVDKRTDIWSLGVVLYEMITGKLPFQGDYDNAVFYNILNQEPELIKENAGDLPQPIVKIVSKSLAKEPAKRYQGLDEMAADLQSYMTGNVIENHLFIIVKKIKKYFWFEAIAVIVILCLLVYFLMPINQQTTKLKMIAVLPFENLGPTEDEYFADGLTEELTSRLAGISNLGVISRTSSMQYKKSNKTLPVIAKELGVDYILEGTIRWIKNGGHDRIRITPQLIKVSDDVHLWADNIDRTFEDIFAVQTEIAERVVKSLDIVMNEAEKRGIENIPTRNMEAYRYYLQSFSYSIYEKQGFDKTIKVCEYAVRLDSTFAEAYLRLSMIHLRYYWFGFDRTKERLSISRNYLDTVFALQKDLPNAKFVLGYYYYYGLYDYDRALESFAEAEKFLPNNARIMLARAYILRRQGNFEKALELQKKGFQLDPKNFNTIYEIGNTLTWLGRFSEAEEYYDRYNLLVPNQSHGLIRKSDIKLLQYGDTRKSRKDIEQIPEKYRPWSKLVLLDLYERNYNSALEIINIGAGATSWRGDLYSFIPAEQMKGIVYLLMKDTLQSHTWFDSARILLQNEIKKNPDDERLHSSLGLVYAGLGKVDAALHEAELAVEMLPLYKDAIKGMFPLINLAQVYTITGKYDKALDVLELLLSPGKGKNINSNILRLDPLYEPLRNSKRFKALLAAEE